MLNDSSVRNFVYSHTKLEVFESKLAYMLIKGIVSLEKAGLLGYSDEYINSLVEFYVTEFNNQYVQYNLDELNERLSVINKEEISLSRILSK